DAALPAEDGVPGRLHGAPDRGHHAKTRYDDTALAHTIPVWRLIESGLAAALVDVVDGLVDGGDLLGILVRDFDLELLLEGHHQLDRVERIRSQVVDERGIVRRRLRSEEHTSELQSRENTACRLLLEQKNTDQNGTHE